jgi:hypothetical protein
LGLAERIWGNHGGKLEGSKVGEFGKMGRKSGFCRTLRKKFGKRGRKSGFCRTRRKKGPHKKKAPHRKRPLTEKGPSQEKAPCRKSALTEKGPHRKRPLTENGLSQKKAPCRKKGPHRKSSGKGEQESANIGILGFCPTPSKEPGIRTKSNISGSIGQKIYNYMIIILNYLSLI